MVHKLYLNIFTAVTESFILMAEEYIIKQKYLQLQQLLVDLLVQAVFLDLVSEVLMRSMERSGDICCIFTVGGREG